MSKMNMMIFAVGIFVVAVLFYGFISGIDLNTQAQNILHLNSKVIEQQVASDSLCSIQGTSIPDRLTSGLGLSNFFYDLDFDKRGAAVVDASTGESSVINYLIMSIKEHNKKTSNVSVNVPMRESIVFIDPGFIAEGKPIGAYFNVPQMTLYPRSAKNGILASPNAFVALREVRNSIGTIYIIPCSTMLDKGNVAFAGNCRWNIVKVGCHILSLQNPIDSNKIPSCFNIDLSADSSGTQPQGSTGKLDWAYCKANNLVSTT